MQKYSAVRHYVQREAGKHGRGGVAWSLMQRETWAEQQSGEVINSGKYCFVIYLEELTSDKGQELYGTMDERCR